MHLTRRLLVGIGGLGVIALAMFAGTGSVSPTISAGTKVATITFTGVTVVGTTTYTINSTSCTLTPPRSWAVPCSLNGGGTLTANGRKPATANIAITTSGGKVISLNLSTLNTCGVGSGVEVPAGGSPFPVVAIIPNGLTISGNTVSGTIQVFRVGNRTVGCSVATTTIGTNQA